MICQVVLAGASGLDDAELRQLEDALRTERTERVARHAAREAIRSTKECQICFERDRSVVLGCGHQLCRTCSELLSQCPFCRTTITNRIHLFD
jgi:sacsin